MTVSPLTFEGVRLPEMDGAGFSLEVAAHRAVVVVARERSGVDRLASYALALETPPGGTVRVFGEDLTRLSRRDALAFRRRVGYLPAGDGLLNNLSLKDNVALPLRFGSDMSHDDIETRIRIMCALLRIGDVGDRRPSAVGEEQRRRTALARALAFDPELVIMEDPFDGLAARTAAELLELARGGETAAGSRRTVFMTSQYVPSLLMPRIEVRCTVEGGSLNVETSA